MARGRIAAPIMLLGLALLASAAPASAADRLKIGFVGDLSGAIGISGQDSLNGMLLALDELGNKLGGLPVTVVTQDSQLKPDFGRQIVDKFIKSDHVDMIIGATASNTMLALVHPIDEGKTVFISTIAGPSQIAGKQCSPYIFDTSWEGDNFAEAMGDYLQKAGKQDIYLVAPNYAAGHDVLTGFKRFYKGKVAGEVYTPLSQLDFSAELAQIRAANPAGVFAFYPGGLGIQFVKQYDQAGLKGKIPLYTSYMIDDSTLPSMGEAALGVLGTTSWTADLDNPANKSFVAAFKAKYHKLPAEEAAQAYDAVNLLDSAVRAVKGKVEDKPAFIAALEKADFHSVKGSFRFANDHFPIVNYDLTRVVKDKDGTLEIKYLQTVLKDYGNAYASECPMK